VRNPDKRKATKYALRTPPPYNAFAKASARSSTSNVENLAIAHSATADDVPWKLVTLRPKPFQEGLQVVGDSLIEHLFSGSRRR
jgi:hypothetical protein